MQFDLREALKLEQLEVNLFRGVAPDRESGRIFGGLVIAQSLLAAYATIEKRLCHSLHCYFIRPGDPAIPIVFEVDRARDGSSFTTRRVIAVQHGKQIFNLAASFQVDEQGFEHQAPMPPDEGAPESYPDLIDLRTNVDRLCEKPENLSFMSPIEVRYIAQAPENGRAPPRQRVRARHQIGDDPALQQAVMAYASDFGLLGTSLRPHFEGWNPPELQPASLDHAMWFHRPSDFSQWHLYDMDSPSASGARGMNRGSIFSADGRLVASAAQEGLIRWREVK